MSAAEPPSDPTRQHNVLTQLAEIDSQLAAVTAERNHVRGEIREMYERLANTVDERQDLRQQMHQLNTKKNDIATHTRKTLSTSLDRIVNQLKDLRSANTEALDERIKQLQTKQGTESLSSKAEDEILNEINTLVQQRDAASKANAVREKLLAEKADVEAKLTENKSALQEVHTHLKSVFDRLAEIEAQFGLQDAYREMKQRRDELNKQVEELLVARQNVQETWRAEIKLQQNHTNKLRKQRNLEQQRQLQSLVEERERRIARQANGSDEAELCDLLLQLLKSMDDAPVGDGQGDRDDVQTDQDDVQTDQDDVQTGQGDVHPHQDDVLPENLTPTQHKGRALCLSSDVVESFKVLGLEPPVDTSMLLRSMEQLEETRERCCSARASIAA